MSDVTQLLNAAAQGDPKAGEELLPLVYDQPRQLAARKMTDEPAGHTLQPTALVHEAWLRIAGDDQRAWQNRAHFFGAAGEAMRRILIEHARRKRAAKHGGELQRVDMAEIDRPAQAGEDTLLRVDEALDALSRDDPAAAELVKLRFFGGLSMEEVALALGVTDRTARRYWRFARVWLHDALSSRTD